MMVIMLKEKGTATAMVRDLRAHLALARLLPRLVGHCSGGFDGK